MKFAEQLENSFGSLKDQIEEYLDRLSSRERMMVIFATFFVAITAIASVLWYMHQAAEQQKNRVQELNDLVVWMQTNVATMRPREEITLTLSDTVNRVAQSQGLSVSAQENNGKVQIIASHESYAILANFITQLTQLGLSIEKMELILENGKIKLTAVVK
jgi:type II secretory pathway component PulM